MISRRILTTSPYRNLNPVQQAVKLYSEEDLSQRQASSLAGVDRSALRRALEAKTQGRPIGRSGRPPVFDESEKENFLSWFQSRVDAGEKPDMNDAQQKVYLIFLLFSLLKFN